MSKILLIYPPPLYAPFWGPPKSDKAHLFEMYSFLRHHRIDTDVIDLELIMGKPKSAEDIRKLQRKAKKLLADRYFDVAAISCWSSLNYLGSLMVARICKDVNSNCLTVVGGYHPSAVPADFIFENSPFDFIVRGEGEAALLDICMGRIKRQDESVIIQGLPLNLNNPVPACWKEYEYFKTGRHKSIYLSRGCSFSCAFCMERSKSLRKWRSYSVNEALGRIDRLLDSRNPRHISIVDACFGFRKKWRKEFLSGLVRRKTDKMFWAESRIDVIDREDVDLISKLNFTIQLGVETFSRKMLAIMRKTRKPDEYLKKCKGIITYMNAKEVPYKLFLIFNHPGETPETYRKSIGYLRNLLSGQSKISGIIGAQSYAFFPGSHTHLHLKQYEEKYGTIVKHREWWKEHGDHHELATDVVSSREMADKKSRQDYWKKDIYDLNDLCNKKMPHVTMAFWWARAETFRDE